MYPQAVSPRASSPLVRALVAVLCLVIPALSGAQVVGETGQVTVQVRDNWGIIPGATVSLTNQATGTAVRQSSDQEGKVVFVGLAPGTYRVSASMEGFADAVAPDVVLTAGGSEQTEVLLTQPQFSTTVTVSTPARRQEVLLNVADPIVLFERAQIQDTGARTSKDLLADQSGSGIQVNAGGGQGHVSINGIANSGVLVMVDGRRYLGKDANGNFNLEDLELTGVDRVEVVKGSGSALYGSDAIGGVINIITRKSQPGFTDQLQTSAGTYDDYRVTNTLGYRRGPAGFSFGSGYRTYDGFDLDETNPQTIGQPESQWQTYNLNGDARLTNRLQLRGIWNFSERDIDNYYFSGPTQLGTVYNSRRELTRTTFAPDVDVVISSDTMLTASYTYGKYDRDETRIYERGEIVQVPWQEWNNEFRLNGRQTWRAWGQEQYFQGGYEYRDEKLDRAGLQFPDGGRKASRNLDVFWLQQDFGIGPRLRVSAGFRYDSYSDFGDEWSPKVTSVYALTGEQRLRFTYGQGFRAPQFGELYLNTPPFFVGNPDLKPERSEGITAGYAWASRRLQASADYFHTNVQDGITFDLSKRPFTYGNLREFVSQGVNGTLSVSLPFGFVPQFSYAYVAREDDNGVEVGGLPKNAANLKILWSESRYGLRANLRAQMIDDVRFDDGTSSPAYQVWSGQVSKRFLPASGFGFTVFAQVDNIFDEKDIFRRDANGEPIAGDFQVWLAPRTFLGGVIFDFDRPW